MLEKNRSNSIISYESQIKQLREKITSLEFNHKIEINILKNNEMEKNSLISNLENIIKQNNEKITYFEKTLKKNRNFELIREMEEKLEKAEKKINQLEKFNINKARLKRDSAFSIENDIKRRLDKRKSFSDVIDKSFNMLDHLKNDRERKTSSGFDNNMELNLFAISEAKKKEKEKKVLKQNQYEVIENLQNIISENENSKINYENIIQEKNREIGKFYQKIEILENNFIEAEEFKTMLLNDLDDSKINQDNKNKKYKELKNKFEKLENELLITKTINSKLDLKLKEFEKEKYDLKNKIHKEKNNFKRNSILFQEQAILLKNHNNQKDKIVADLKNKLEKIIFKNSGYQKKLDALTLEKDNFESLLKENLKNMEHDFRLENSQLQDKIIELKKINIKQTASSFSDINKKKGEVEINKNIEEGLGLEGLQIGLDMLSEDNELDHLDISEDDSREEEQIRERIRVKSKIINNLDIKKTLCLSKNFSEENSLQIIINEKDNVISDLNNKIIEYIEKIEGKDLEIHKFRKICIENEEKENFVSLEIYNNEINLLKMDIDHLKKNEIILKENWKKKQKKLNEDFDDMTHNCLNAKLKQTEILSEMDSLKLLYNRELRKMKYKVELYEKEIDTFNKKISKK